LVAASKKAAEDAAEEEVEEGMAEEEEQDVAEEASGVSTLNDLRSPNGERSSPDGDRSRPGVHFPPAEERNGLGGGNVTPSSPGLVTTRSELWIEDLTEEEGGGLEELVAEDGAIVGEDLSVLMALLAFSLASDDMLVVLALFGFGGIQFRTKRPRFPTKINGNPTAEHVR
jgi:hypothetical protein